MMAAYLKPGIFLPNVPLPEVQIIDGEFDGDVFKVKRYPDYKDLCDPELHPIFYMRLPANKAEAPSEWIILYVPGEPDAIYKADPRTADIQREWKQGEKFPDFLPVYQVKKIGRWNPLAKKAKGKVNEWIRKEFTSSPTEAQSATSAG